MERRSERRLSIDLPGSFRRGGDPLQVMYFSQISSKGCRMTAEDAALTTGERIELFLGPVGPIDAQVRWINETGIGVEFEAPLDPAIVGYFVAFINERG